MKRLVYAPRAYVFVKDQEGVIHDLTQYVTAGQVQRLTDQVSTAEITLRNPEMLFTVARLDDGSISQPLFHPMDPITIWLRRVRDRPVRVFTGFLDTAPYLNLFPGPITMKASCTLKRLVHTYFDPALPYTMSFLETYGWVNYGGQWVSTTAMKEFLPIGSDATTNPLTPTQGVDGTLSQLLFATLKHIGSWSAESVYIEPLPQDLFDRLNDMAADFNKDNEEAKDEFKKLLKNILGAGAQGSADGTGTDVGANPTSSGEVKGIDKITQTIVATANKYGVDPAMVMAVCDIETGYGQNMHRPGAPYWGWYQININGSRYSKPITQAQALDLGYSCALFCKGAVNTVPAADKKDPLTWAMVTQGVGRPGAVIGPNDLYPSSWDGAYARAKANISKYATGANKDLGTLGTTPDRTIRASTSSTNSPSSTKSTATDPKIYAPIKGGTTNISAPYGEKNHGSPPHTHMGIDVPVPTGTDCIAPCDGRIGRFASADYAFGGAGGMVHFVFDQDVGDIKKGTVIGWGHVGQVFVKAGETVKGGQVLAKSNHPAPHVHFIARNDDLDMDGNIDPTPVFKALQKGSTAPTSGSTDPSTGGGASSDVNVTTGAGAAAFFGSLELPGAYDAIAASMLSGEKSLMNDKPLLPFIQQLCSASLRHFQSLPDGRFYAFYPDYFGEMNQHPPYWDIDDIEILDGKIELTDDPLVTHSYVVGDTTNPMGGDTPFALRSVWSSGVVTIFNAFMASSVLDRTGARKKDKQRADRASTKTDVANTKQSPVGMDIILDRDEAAGFLERYGARPAVEDMPMIKSPYFEMFLAYQNFLLAWSKQFSTPFTFTFMPELFPGGKVGFPDHGLQMYIEDVTHTWDYESGFMTTATLTAPSAYGKTALLPDNMVQAIIQPSHPEKQAKQKGK